MLETQNTTNPTEDPATELSQGKSNETNGLKKIPEKVGVKFQTDPGKFYLFLLIRVGGFDSLTDLREYVGSHNDSLLGQLDTILSELESSQQISISGDSLEIGPEGFDLEMPFSSQELFAEFSAALTRRAFIDYPIDSEKYRNSTGFEYFTFRNNKNTISKAKAIYDRFRAEMLGLSAEPVCAETSEFVVMSVSRACPKPEDF